MPVIAPRAPAPIVRSSTGAPEVPAEVRHDAPEIGPDPAEPPAAPLPGRTATVDPVARPAPGPAAIPGPVAVPRPGGIRGDGTETLVFRRPAPAPTRAILRVTGRDGSERTIEVDGTPLTLGRASDNVLVLGDARVSRHHARLQARRGTLVFTDLGSTNGSRVNGVRVDECALGAGDRVQVGDTVLLVEQLPG